MRSSNSDERHELEVKHKPDCIQLYSNHVKLAEIRLLTAYDGDKPTDAFYLTFLPDSGKLSGNNQIYHAPER